MALQKIYSFFRFINNYKIEYTCYWLVTTIDIPNLSNISACKAFLNFQYIVLCTGGRIKFYVVHLVI